MKPIVLLRGALSSLRANPHRILYVAFPLLFTAAMAALCAYFASSGMDWYASLTAEPIDVGVFALALIWLFMFVLLATAFCLVLWQSDGQCGILFLLNGVLLPLWCWFFFGSQRLYGALLLLFFIFLQSFFLLYHTRSVSKIAALVLLPYPLVLAYSVALTYLFALFS